MDVQKIPIDELLADLIESAKDVQVCDLALLAPNPLLPPSKFIETQKRRDVNLNIIEAIKAEIKRRTP